MSGELLWTRRDGKEFHRSDIVSLNYDNDFAMWNDLVDEKHGLLVDTIDYVGLGNQSDIMAYVLIGNRFMHFDWDDIEVVREEG